ncbi:MAG: hypothetical protein AB4372_07415 [Xenococcus sp. (in: cyanobacteria)]
MSSLKTKIVKQLDNLPDNALKQVSDFIDFLAWRVSVNAELNQTSDDKSLEQKEDIAWLETDLSNLSEYEPYEWQSGELEQGISTEVDTDQTEPQIYKVGTALVVKSIPIDNIENSVEKMREERISQIIANDESSV